MVPAPGTAPSTSSATARMASSATGVLNVISMALSPPATSARASGTAVSHILNDKHRHHRLQFQNGNEGLGFFTHDAGPFASSK
jgi:hypothetical protein